MPQQRPMPTEKMLRAQAIAEDRQPRRLALALVLLLVAFAGVLYRDQDFWFGTRTSSVDSEAAQPQVAQQSAAKSAPSAAKPTVAVAAPAPTQKKQAVAANKPSAEPKAADAAVVTNRTALPPLDVEVVAGDNHKTVHPGSNVTKVEITRPSSAKTGTADLAVPTNAAAREVIAADSIQPQGSIDATYPMLARQSKVEGSVVLQALIGSDGAIQDVYVVSGPAILSSAAREAVRQWRFKPYLQNGQPVETKAKITVNFTIKVSDNSASKTS